MKISNAFPSKYLRCSDLQDHEITVTMSHVSVESIGMGDSESKPVLYFEGKKKGLVLNKTNSKTIAHAYGDDTDEWLGKPVILFPAMVDFRGDQVEAVRVRVPKLTPQQRPAQTTVAAPAAAPQTVTHEDMAALDDEIPF